MRVLPLACVASTVTRLTMSLGKPGQTPVVTRPAPVRVDSSTRKEVSSSRVLTPKRESTARIGSMSWARTPRTSTSPPVTAAATAQLPASMKSPSTRWLAPERRATPLTRSVLVPSPVISAPIRLRKRASSATCGSQAALRMSVVPEAVAAARRAVSVAVTEASSR